MASFVDGVAMTVDAMTDFRSIRLSCTTWARPCTRMGLQLTGSQNLSKVDDSTASIMRFGPLKHVGSIIFMVSCRHRLVVEERRHF